MRTINDLHDYQRKAINFQCIRPNSALWMDMGLGKQQPNSEPVLTPDGWKPMGELKVGDYVIGANGRPTEVIGVFPQGEHETVKVTFTDGSYCHVGWEHLWYVQNPAQKNRNQVGHVMTTRQLVDTNLMRPMGNRVDAYWHIPMVEPVEFPEKNFPIEPYTLGAILGDGTTHNGHVTLCTDKEIIEAVGARFLRDHDTCDYVGYGSMPGIAPTMRELGLDGKRSWEKFIPVQYMLGSASQRLALLQGLCDTDGSPITSGGGLEFSSTSEALIDGVVELTQSLGGVASKSDVRITHHQNGEGRPSWRVNVKLPSHLEPFRLKRKLAKWIRPTKYPAIRKMVSAEVVGREQATCIKVAASDSLYVTRNYIVTHNTCITLTSIEYLLRVKYLKAVVIVAPIRVCRLVWRQEAAKWDHTKDIKFSMMIGTHEQRLRALMQPAQVFLINYENLGWMAETLQTYFISKGRELPFDGIVFDEVSKCKNSTTQRVKSLRKVLHHFKWTTGLTGTPASNGYKDLHGQYLVLDGGKRLGTSKTAFKTRFYRKEGPYKEVPYSDTEEVIKHLIGDMTLEMSAEDYNPLPDLIVNDVNVELPVELRAKYDLMEKEFFIALDSGTEVEMFNAASLTNKCLAEGTEVLTYDGWKVIESLSKNDFVWDGLEWVNISGIVYNGYKHVVDCWGVSMTPDHKVLTTQGWKTAEEILDEQSCERYDRAKVRTPYSACEGGEQGNKWDVCSGVVESSMRLWGRTSNARSKFEKQTQDKTEVLRVSAWGNNRYTSYDKYSSMDYLEKYEVQMQSSFRQRLVELWGSWNKSVSGVGRFIREVLERYGPIISGSFDLGTPRREQRVLQRKLSMGNKTATREQHPIKCDYSDTYWQSNSSSSGTSIQSETNHYLQTNSQRVVGGGLDKARVYDVINAGPRHRFTVRGKNGKVFIAHNCLQFSNGAMYPVAGVPIWEPIHDLKLDALEDILEESNGKPILCSYAYRSDAERIMKRFTKEYGAINLTECKSEKSLKDAMEKWQDGRCKLMIGHAASMGHGIDGLQRNGGMLVWFGLNWSLDLYDQFNARIRRQGRGDAPVVCHRIMTLDTLDQAQALALDEKAVTQDGLRKAVKEYRLAKNK